MKKKSILSDIFDRPEEEVKAFVDAFPDEEAAQFDKKAGGSGEKDNSFSGRPDRYSMPNLKEEVSKLIKIEHGYNDNDYVWHISTHHPRRPWKVNTENVVYAIVIALAQGCIDQKTEVKYWLPQKLSGTDYKIDEFTFIAVNLKTSWKTDDIEIRKTTENLFEVLNGLV